MEMNIFLIARMWLQYKHIPAKQVICNHYNFTISFETGGYYDFFNFLFK